MGGRRGGAGRGGALAPLRVAGPRGGLPERWPREFRSAVVRAQPPPTPPRPPPGQSADASSGGPGLFGR